jgi:selenocysteine lyase/cysteine desulfurase
MNYAEKVKDKNIKYCSMVFTGGIPQWLIDKINDVYERTKNNGGQLEESVF